MDVGFDGADPLVIQRLRRSGSEVVDLLVQPEQNVVVSLTGVDIAERPRFFAEMLPELSKSRTQTARPHWLLIG